MSQNPILSEFFQKAKRSPYISGILFSIAITMIIYLFSLGTSLLFLGDIHMIIGNIIGIRFLIKYDNSEKPPLIIGSALGAISGILSSIALAFFEWGFYIARYGLVFLILLDRINTFIWIGILIGVAIGFLFGFYYNRKRKEPKESLVDDKFFDDLKE
jgi:Na+/H+-translocating membrane pyrophosphatase